MHLFSIKKLMCIGNIMNVDYVVFTLHVCLLD